MRLNQIISSKYWVSSYKLDDLLLQNLIRTFYGALLVIDYWFFLSLAKMSSIDGLNWLWPISWLKFFEAQNQIQFVHLLYFSTVVTHALCILNPNKKHFKAAAAILFFLMVSALYSFGKIDHHLYGFLFASLAIIFLKPFSKDDLQIKRNKFYFLITQVSVLVTYSLSGLWKLRYFIEQVFLSDKFLLNPIQNQLSWNSIQSFSRPLGNNLLVQNPNLASCLWILIIAFETFAISFVLLPKFQRYIGIGIILLHMNTAFFLDIYYTPAALLAAILFCAHPYVKRENIIR